MVNPTTQVISNLNVDDWIYLYPYFSSVRLSVESFFNLINGCSSRNDGHSSDEIRKKKWSARCYTYICMYIYVDIEPTRNEYIWNFARASTTNLYSMKIWLKGVSIWFSRINKCTYVVRTSAILCAFLYFSVNHIFRWLVFFQVFQQQIKAVIG